MAEDFQFKAAEMMKKVLTLGVGALFLTEESLRGLVTEFKLPKEILAAVLDSASKTKDEFFRTLSKEMIAQVSERVDSESLLKSVLEKYEIEFTVKVNVKPKEKDRDKQHDKSHDRHKEKQSV